MVNDPALKSVVVDQTKQWSDMMERHRKEEWEMLKVHLQAQEEVLKKLLEEAQAKQIGAIKAIFDRYLTNKKGVTYSRYSGFYN